MSRLPWTRVSLVLFLVLPVLALGTWWQLLDVILVNDAFGLPEAPSPVWRLGDPDRGAVVALRDHRYYLATVVGVPGDKLSTEPEEFTVATRLTVTWSSGSRSLDLADSRGLDRFPLEVHQGSRLVFGEYWGTGGDSVTYRLATLVRRSQVHGTILDGWREDAIYGTGTILGLTWLAAASFVIFRLARGHRQSKPDRSPELR